MLYKKTFTMKKNIVRRSFKIGYKCTPKKVFQKRNLKKSLKNVKKKKKMSSKVKKTNHILLRIGMLH